MVRLKESEIIAELVKRKDYINLNEWELLGVFAYLKAEKKKAQQIKIKNNKGGNL